MKRTGLIILIMITILAILGITRSFVANTLSTTGTDLSKTQEEIAEYKRQNALLKEEILRKSSLTSLAEYAEEEGLEVSKKQLSLTDPVPLAYSR